MESTLKVDNAVFKHNHNMLICCMNVKNKYRLLLLSLAVEEPICIQFTGYIWWKSSKCPHHYI